MRKKIISIIILLLALIFFTYGLILAQYNLINGFYAQMIAETSFIPFEDIVSSINF